jgi:hypothetical protein
MVAGMMDPHDGGGRDPVKRLFIIASIVSGIAVLGLAVGIASVGASDPGPRGVRSLSVLLYGGFGASLTILITALALLLWSGAIVRRRNAVKATNPHAEVLVVQRTAQTNAELSAILGGRVELPSLLVLGLGGGELGIWGRDDKQPVAVIDRDRLRAVDVVDVYNGRRMPAVALSVELPDGGNGSLTFIPCRERWEIWAILDRAQTAEIARKFATP